jgi:hypothetical protein
MSRLPLWSKPSSPSPQPVPPSHSNFTRGNLGPWQQIFYMEFDGQRRKRLVIKAMGE